MEVGDEVIYIPSHANGDPIHLSCEFGVITSINHSYVFVRFERDPQQTKACNPQNIQKIVDLKV